MIDAGALARRYDAITEITRKDSHAPLENIRRGLVANAAFIPGCASITTGKIQPPSVPSTCDSRPLVGAHCKLTHSNRQWFVETPGSVSIQKALGDLPVDCSKAGLTPASGLFKSSSNGGVWGNVIAGGVIGYAIDASNGAGFDYPRC